MHQRNDPQAIVDEATLDLYYTGRDNGNTLTVGAHRVVAEWIDSEVTHFQRKAGINAHCRTRRMKHEEPPYGNPKSWRGLGCVALWLPWRCCPCSAALSSQSPGRNRRKAGHLPPHLLSSRHCSHPHPPGGLIPRPLYLSPLTILLWLPRSGDVIPPTKRRPRTRSLRHQRHSTSLDSARVYCAEW